MNATMIKIKTYKELLDELEKLEHKFENLNKYNEIIDELRERERVINKTI